MKFEVFHLAGISAKFLHENKEKLNELLKNSLTLKDDKLSYCINNIDIDESIIGGTLSQEYIGGLTTVINKVETPIDENPWEKTYFFIDTVSAKVLIQRRKYSPKNLNHNKSVNRIEEILRDVFLKEYQSTLSLIKTSIGTNNDYFKDIVLSEDVKMVKVGNLLGKKVPVGTTLHNPREDWDRVWAESWNEYDSEIVEEIVIKTAKDKDLSRSVINKALIAANGDFKAVSYFDAEEEKVVRVSKNSVGTLSLQVSKDEEPVTILKKGFEKIINSRDAIKRFFIK